MPTPASLLAQLRVPAAPADPVRRAVLWASAAVLAAAPLALALWLVLVRAADWGLAVGLVGLGSGLFLFAHTIGRRLLRETIERGSFRAAWRARRAAQKDSR